MEHTDSHSRSLNSGTRGYWHSLQEMIWVKIPQMLYAPIERYKKYMKWREILDDLVEINRNSAAVLAANPSLASTSAWQRADQNAFYESVDVLRRQMNSWRYLHANGALESSINRGFLKVISRSITITELQAMEEPSPNHALHTRLNGLTTMTNSVTTQVPVKTSSWTPLAPSFAAIEQAPPEPVLLVQDGEIVKPNRANQINP